MLTTVKSSSLSAASSCSLHARHSHAVAYGAPKLASPQPARAERIGGRTRLNSSLALRTGRWLQTRAFAARERCRRTQALSSAVTVQTAIAAQPVAALAAVALLVAAVGIALQKLATGRRRPRVVVVGASFAGLQAAFDLRGIADVLVLDQNSFFEARFICSPWRFELALAVSSIVCMWAPSEVEKVSLRPLQFTPGVLRALVKGSLRSRQLPLQVSPSSVAALVTLLGCSRLFPFLCRKS